MTAVIPGRPAPLAVAHVAEFNRRYPGEPLTLFTRVEVLSPAPGFTLRVSLPPLLQLQRSSAGPNEAEEPQLVVVADEQFVSWTVARDLRPGERFQYQVQTQVGHVETNRTVESEAVVIVPAPHGDESLRVAETAAIFVSAKGAYLKYLPAIYTDEDELMGRFLMLFESFWAPIEKQIEAVALYFDPLFTPVELLPWLAAWVDLTLDERWPEAKRRRLLRSAVALYRQRGTRPGLQEYLEIYTGAEVEITEHGAHNFRLGPNARLGPGVALGTINQPHTFTVTALLPADDGDGHIQTPEQRARFAAERRHMIEMIIEAEKPAHTSYRLRLETQ